ncbi:MAG: PEGA domain-containing protein, partial [Myxococcales bacterium]|nr:PEGA domain-containing protein [Myxococcales bacterium]
PATPGAPGKPAAHAAARTIRLKIVTDPDDATVVLDGHRLGHAPLRLERPREPRTVPLKIRRRGYHTRILQVSLDADLDLTVELTRRARRR